MKILDVKQRSEEWFRARCGLPTCSRFGSILTPVELKRSSAQETLINELIAESLRPIPPEGFIESPVTAQMEYGIETEEEAHRAVARAQTRPHGLVIGLDV